VFVCYNESLDSSTEYLEYNVPRAPFTTPNSLRPERGSHKQLTSPTSHTSHNLAKPKNQLLLDTDTNLQQAKNTGE
jgi:hypothetical protein